MRALQQFRSGRSRTVLTLGVGAAVYVGAAGYAGAAGGPGRPTATPDSPTGLYANGASLVSGRLVKPAGVVRALGDFPIASAVSPDGALAVVVNSGEGQGGTDQGNESLQVVRLRDNAVVQTVTDHQPGQPTFYNAGVAFSPNGSHVYVTGGGNDQVYDYAVSGAHLTLAHRFRSTKNVSTPGPARPPNGGVPATAPLVGDVNGYSRGLTVTPDGRTVIVTNEQGGTVTALDPVTGVQRWETPLGGVGQGGGAYPGAVTLSNDGARALVTEQGHNAVATLDVATGTLRGVTAVGDHPSAIAVTRNSHFAFVSNTNDDSVSILDLTRLVPTEVRRISVHLLAGEANGSAPNGITIDSAQSLVYVADAGDNAVAVLGAAIPAGPSRWNPAQFRALGFIPAGNYPTAVSVVPRSGDLLTSSAKGYGGVPVTRRTQYDGNDIVGLLSRVARPTTSGLAAYTKQSRDQLLFATKANSRRPADSPVPAAVGGTSPIKHVVMIVRENRTFDQEFGDLRSLGRTNADVEPAFTQFGRRNASGQTVTPNIHNLADRYALSQNFYSDGEASIQGHHWTAEGTSTDYTEKSWVHYYSARNHPYDPTAPIVYPRCGAIFQQLAAQHKTFRDFGELVGQATSQAPSTPSPGAACAVPGGTNDPKVAANTATAYPNNLLLTSVKDTDRLKEFKTEYAPLVAANTVPQLSYLLMGNDHTDGATPGKTTPQGLVATNDEAVGGVIDYLSHTPQWSSTAVFVMEDDSQDGLDHRDGHRNIFLLASPYAAKAKLSGVHISQAGVLHTIELILGLRPLSNYTQYAPVPYDMFTPHPDTRPYTAEKPTYPQDAKNPPAPAGSAASVPVNTSSVDVAGPVLEAQLWQSTHPGAPMPAALVREVRSRGGINDQAAAAWAAGRSCGCAPLQPGLTAAHGSADADG